MIISRLLNFPPLLASLATVLLVCACAAGSAQARAPISVDYGSPPRPDLRVVVAPVLAGTGEVRGSFEVLNDGEATVKNATASIVVREGDGFRELQRFRLRPLDAGVERTVSVAFAAPSITPTSRLRICADWVGVVRESREGNNCRAAAAPLGR